MDNISVNELVESSSSDLPREIKLTFAKNILSTNKKPDEAKKEFCELVEKLNMKRQQNVINATGTVLHTNLGRSPVNMSYSGSYTNVEYDLTTSSRGSRNSYLTESMKTLLNAEDVAFVNNNASSLYLTLLCLSKKYSKDSVIVSRGEIIEIGGSYRLPDIISETGMKLVEVGTTNKTRIDDYKDALKINPNAILLKVHRSNFSISGFTEEVDIKQLNILKNEYESLLIHDLGSGLVANNVFLSKHNLTMFQKEPRVQQSLRDGSDIVMFSGDKLFGSLQSGIIAGKAKLVKAIKSFSIFRTFRCSPVVLYELQETTDFYIKKSEEKIPFWNLLTRTYDELELRIHKIIKDTTSKHKIIKGESLIGGGTLPNIKMASPVLVLDTKNNVAILSKFLNNKTPIVPRISDGNVNLDIRSVFEYQDNEIAEFLNLI